MLKPLFAAPLLALASTLALTPSLAYAQDTPLNAVQSAPDVEADPALKERAEEVIRLFKGEVAAQDIFSPTFLKAVPADQLRGLTTTLTAQFGPVIGLERLTPKAQFGGEIAIRFERAIGTGGIAVDPEEPHKIGGLLLQKFEPIDDSIAKIKAELEALPGEVGVYFGPLDGNNPRLALNADKQMAIGSAFKVYILSALTRKIQSGGANWDDVIPITTRSFPSGMMQDWPDPAPVTLQTMATMMIAISDNTATDSLLDYLGQEAVIREVRASGHTQPDLNVPFLQTKQLFTMKAAGDELLNRYRAADTAGKYAILDSVKDSKATPQTIDAAFANGPYALDLEWFASAQDLRRMMDRLPKGGDGMQMKIMSVNPSVPDSAYDTYPRVYYKGGSEPGVLNFTWLLYDKSATPHVLAMSWTNPDAVLVETAFELLAQRLLLLSPAEQ
jgi:beta-lactamase class A